MNRFRALANQHARLTAMIVLAFFAGIFAVPVLLHGPVDLSDDRGLIDLTFLLTNIPAQAGTCLIVLLAVALLAWWRETGLISKIDRRGLRIALYITAIPLIFFLIIALVLLADQPDQGHLAMLAVILIFNLLVGLFEETLFRGIVFHGLRTRHSLWVSIILSSLLFGIFHIVNLAIGQDLDITVFQVVNATALGIFFCAIVLQANNLWPAIILHAVWNSYAMAGQLAASNTVFDDLQPSDFAVKPANYVLPLLITVSAVWLINLWQRRAPPPIPATPISH